MEANTELIIRVGAALGIFSALALWEVLSPRRAMLIGRARRWPSNLGILVLDALLVRLLIPVAAVGVAVIAAQRGWGLLNITPWPAWLEALFGFLALDLVSGRVDREHPLRTWLLRRGDILRAAGREEEAKKNYREALAAIERLPEAHRNTRATVELQEKIRAALERSKH